MRMRKAKYSLTKLHFNLKNKCFYKFTCNGLVTALYIRTPKCRKILLNRLAKFAVSINLYFHKSIKPTSLGYNS